MRARRFDRRNEAAESRRRLDQRYQPAAVALESSGKFKLEQDGTHDRWRGFRHPNEVVEQNRCRSQ